MWCRPLILILALLAAACGSREADAPQTSEEATRDFEAALKGATKSDAGGQDAPSDAPASRAVECAIDWRGERYVERCRYYPQAGGSFAIIREAGGELVPGATSIGVFVNPDGSAIVSGTDSTGRAVRWGIAQRAPQNDDCWEGEGFWVCAG